MIIAKIIGKKRLVTDAKLHTPDKDTAVRGRTEIKNLERKTNS